MSAVYFKFLGQTLLEVKEVEFSLLLKIPKEECTKNSETGRFCEALDLLTAEPSKGRRTKEWTSLCDRSTYISKDDLNKDRVSVLRVRKLIKKFFDESVQDDLLAIVPLCEDDDEVGEDAAESEDFTGYITFFKLDDGGDGKITAHNFVNIKDAEREGSDFTKGWRLPAQIDKECKQNKAEFGRVIISLLCLVPLNVHKAAGAPCKQRKGAAIYYIDDDHSRSFVKTWNDAIASGKTRDEAAEICDDAAAKRVDEQQDNVCG